MATNYTMISGDTQIVEVTVLDEDGATLDVSSAPQIRYAIADRYSPALLVTKDRTSGIVADAEKITVTLLPADTAGLAGVYAHELEITDGAGHVYTPLQGTVNIRKDSLV